MLDREFYVEVTASLIVNVVVNSYLNMVNKNIPVKRNSSNLKHKSCRLIGHGLWKSFSGCIRPCKHVHTFSVTLKQHLLFQSSLILPTVSFSYMCYVLFHKERVFNRQMQHI